MNSITRSTTLLFLLLLIGVPLQTFGQAPPPFQFPYLLHRPDQVMEMPAELEEISGITFSADFKELVAIQDEDGILYFINPRTGIVDRKLPFWDKGDYEDLVFTAPDRLWVVKSTSTIYEIIGWENAGELQVIKHKSHLCKDNNVEGLGYDPRSNSLLMACKGDVIKGGDEKNSRAICRFQLDRKEVHQEPVALVDLQAVRAWLKANKSKEEIDEHFEKLFDEDRDEMHFAPSGIAIHPLTGHWYLTSSRGNYLLVMDERGTILFMEKMPPAIHPQPEGITFDREGNLFIANEAKKKKRGNILRFDVN